MERIIIGREKEIAEIEELYESRNAELLAVYGRRRVGKTFLIKQTLQDRFTFYHAGLSPLDDENHKTSTKDQIQAFYYSMLRAGLDEGKSPESWLEAFYMLETLLEELDNGKRQVLFIDELPWMDTPKSGFLKAFESFWNGWANGRNILMVICGSATSWMLNNIINSHGGLYNRVTREIHLSPFTLKEAGEFLKSKDIMLSDYDVAEAYMILGGIPYYLNYFSKGISLAQNIDQLLFAKRAKLGNEFYRLFQSLFAKPEEYKNVIRKLSENKQGLSRTELAKAIGKTSGGAFSEMLNTLESSEFITHYIPLGNNNNECLYKLTDPFCRFYLRFVEGNTSGDHNFWYNSRNLGSVNAWRGLSFEDLCFSHIDQIKDALKIGGVLSHESAMLLRGNSEQSGSQMDMVIKRNDHIINLCEIKFTLKPFEIDNEYAEKLQERIDNVRELINDPNAEIHLTFITSNGVKKNQYSGMVQKEVRLADMMRN